MSANFLPNGRQTFIAQNGGPLVGGKVYLYEPDTVVPKDSWQNSAKTILNENPVILDGYGSASIYGEGTYRQVLRDSVGNLIWDVEVSTLPEVWDLQRDPYIVNFPTGNPPRTLSSLNVQGTTSSQTIREFLGSFGLVVTQGRGESVPPGFGGHKVALYAGVVASTIEAGDIWAFNTVTTMQPGTGSDYNVHGYELDLNNLQGNRRLADLGPATAAAFGLSITGAGNYISTAAIFLSGPSSAIWETGILAGNGCIEKYLIHDTTNNLASIKIDGIHTYGLDVGQGVCNGGVLRAAQGQYLVWTGVSETSPDVKVLALSGTNLLLGSVAAQAGLTGIVACATLVPSATTLYALGAAAARWNGLWTTTINFNNVISYSTGTQNIDLFTMFGPNLRIGPAAASANFTTIFTQGSVLPAGTVQYSLGSSDLQWQFIFGQTLNLSGVATVSALVSATTVSAEELISEGLTTTVNLNVVQNQTIGGNLSVTGTIVTASTVTAANYSTAGSVAAGQNGAFGGTLTVAGAATFQSDINVTGLLTATNDIQISRDGIIGRNLTVTTKITTPIINVALVQNGVVDMLSVSGPNIILGKIGGNPSITGTLVSSHLTPSADATYALGGGSLRWTDVYAVNGVINTSDVREKEDIVQIENALEMVRNITGIYFKWKVGDEKIHAGFSAQNIQEVFGEQFGMVTDTHGRLGVRTMELLAISWEAIAELDREVKRLQQLVGG